MPYTAEHKAQTRQRIIESAAHQLCEKGIGGVSVAELMKEAGLTHGGFYAHFGSKAALVAEAAAYALGATTQMLNEAAEGAPPSRRLKALVDTYVNRHHVAHPGEGCAIAALGPELSRETPKTRKAFGRVLDKMISMVASHTGARSEKAAREQAIATIATMVGTIVMARAVDDKDFANEILKTGREAALRH